jgi:hypothetical protein
VKLIGTVVLIATGIALGLALGGPSEVLADPLTVGLGTLAVLVFVAVYHWRAYGPVEIAVDETTLCWDGERVPLSIVASAEARDGTVSVQSIDGASLFTVDGVSGPAADWLALVLTAMAADAATAPATAAESDLDARSTARTPGSTPPSP